VARAGRGSAVSSDIFALTVADALRASPSRATDVALPGGTHSSSLPVWRAAKPAAIVRSPVLGHASAAMTLDTYSDLFDDDLDALAERLDRAASGTSGAIWTNSRGG